MREMNQELNQSIGPTKPAAGRIVAVAAIVLAIAAIGYYLLLVNRSEEPAAPSDSLSLGADVLATVTPATATPPVKTDFPATMPVRDGTKLDGFDGIEGDLKNLDGLLNL